MTDCPTCMGGRRAGSPGELRWTISALPGGGNRVVLSGQLTERTELERLAGLKTPVVFDMAAVPYINTTGAMALVRLVTGLGPGVAFERCTPLVMRQLNLVSALADAVQVRSAVVAYECPSCHLEHELLIDVGERRPVEPDARCCGCQAAMEPDEPFEGYFSFLPP